MRKALVAFAALLFIAVSAHRMEAQYSEVSAGVDARVISSDGTSLGNILSGAPAYEVFDVVNSYFRIDLDARRWSRNTGFNMDDDGDNCVYYTFGGTDTSATTLDGFSWDIGGTALPFQAITYCGEDNAEGVIISCPIWFIDDALDTWFYGKFGLVDVDGDHIVAGLWGGTTPFGAKKASPWEDGTGRINDSIHGLFFNLLGGGTSPAETLWVECRKDADSTRTAVELTTPIADDAAGTAATFEVAFHIFGRDSVQYYINGDTGSLDVSAVLAADTEPVMVGFAVQEEGAGLDVVRILKLWGAVAP